MFLKKLNIEGYKNFKEPFNISFVKCLNVLVGENGAGKSAIIDAIRLLLLEDEFGRSPISEADFHRPFDSSNTQTKSFCIKCDFENLSKEETVAFLPWTNLEEQASLTLIVDNKPNNKGRYKRALWGGSSRASIFEWELFDTIHCIYLPPLRDAEAKLREGKGSRLARLLKNLNKKSIKAAKDKNELHALEQKVKKFNEELASDNNGPIAQANNLIRNRLSEALGKFLGQDTHIQFSETNFNRIVESLRLLFFPEIKSSTSLEMFRSLEENSLGYNNLLYLATVLAELTTDIDEPEFLKLLLIEEPEAHLHPQLQIRLLKYLQKAAKDKNVQIIVTTHSPVLASAVTLDSLIHLSSSKRLNQKAVPLNSCGLTGESSKFISRWLDATKSILLFAKGLIFVEGIAEAMLLPELSKIILNNYNNFLENQNQALPASLEDGGVSLVNMNGIYFKHFMQLFCDLNGSNNNNIPVRCSGITDNDPPKNIEIDGKKTPSKPSPSRKFIGKNPALNLIAQIKKSDNVRLYANEFKTFEYDLAMEGGNMNFMIPVAKSLLTTNGPIKRKFKQLEKTNWAKEKSDEKRSKAAYFLLTHIEKGEFAQSLADYVETDKQVIEITIPEYIKKAVIWACGG